MSCIFCDQLAAGNACDFGDSLFCGRLDVHPVSPGHVIIVPRRHVTRLCDLTQEEWGALQRMQVLAVKFIESPDRERMVRLYETIFNARITKNSPWFVKKAWGHPRFGTKPDAYNHIVNEGEAAGQTVMHLHWHVIPRYIGDVEDPSGGGRYVIPEMGNYKNPRT